MIGKALFALLLLVAIALLVMRNKRPPLASPATARAAAKPSVARQTAWLFIAIILLVSGVAAIWQWQDRQQEVTVAVIDTLNGRVTEYRSRANLVEDRRFETLDGRRIQVADNERIEVRK